MGPRSTRQPSRRTRRRHSSSPAIRLGSIRAPSRLTVGAGADSGQRYPVDASRPTGRSSTRQCQARCQRLVVSDVARNGCRLRQSDGRGDRRVQTGGKACVALLSRCSESGRAVPSACLSPKPRRHRPHVQRRDEAFPRRSRAVPGDLKPSQEAGASLSARGHDGPPQTAWHARRVSAIGAGRRRGGVRQLTGESLADCRAEERVAIGARCELGGVFDASRQRHRDDPLAERLDQARAYRLAGRVGVEDRVQPLPPAQ